MNKTIGIVIYGNPDEYPPVINAISILSKEFNLLVVCRNQNKVQIRYQGNVKIYRLGKWKTSEEKEKQNFLIKFLEYTLFIIRTIFILRSSGCILIYAYDMHALLAGFLASRIGKKIKFIYHSFDLSEFKDLTGFSCLIKYLEMRLVHFTDRIVFCDINRARYFKEKAKISKLPYVVMNTPLTVNELPENKLEPILNSKGFDANTKVVLYQGALNKDHYILEVIRSMIFWPKDAIFVLIGYVYVDFMDNFWKEVKKLKLTPRIIQLPSISYDELFCYTVGAYLGIALYSSINYNQIFNAGASNKIFEYLSMGVPVVTNDSAFFREVIDPSLAYFVNPDSVKAISQVVRLALQDQEDHFRKSQAARRLHLAKFNYQHQFKPISDYIKSQVKTEENLPRGSQKSICR